MKHRILSWVMILALIPMAAVADGGYWEDPAAEGVPIVDVETTDPIVPETWQNPGVSYYVGQTVVFGRYEQDGSAVNGQEPIEWQVLEVQGSRVMLISRQCLAGLPYHQEYTKETWDTCSVRNWLNQSFLYAAFTEAERQAIQTTWVDNGVSQRNRSWSSAKTGGDTQDKVFLLSWAEAERYFPGNDSRICWMTTAAGAQRYRKAGEKAWWWLRSAGKSNLGAAIVQANGGLSSQHINEDTGGIRPVIWVEMGAGTEEIIY